LSSTKAAVGAVTAVGFLINMPVAITMMKIMQIIEYLVYIDVDLPKNLLEFLELMGGSVLDLSYNLFEVDEEVKKTQKQGERILLEEEEAEDAEKKPIKSKWKLCTSPRKFGEYDASCYLFNNLGPQVTLCLILLLLRGLISILVRNVKQSQKYNFKQRIAHSGAADDSFNMPLKIEADKNISQPNDAPKTTMYSRLVVKADKYLSVGFFFYLLKAAQLDILIPSFLYIVVYLKNSPSLTLTYVSDETSIGGVLKKPSSKFLPSVPLLLLSVCFIGFYFAFVAISSMFGVYLEIERQKEEDSKGGSVKSLKKKVR
jgi:hypothetical protein